jgi:AbrB family looped-hinge helix DNA binding protein
MELAKAALGDNGRIIIPATIRKKLNLKKGDYIIFKSDNDDIKLSNSKAALNEARELLKTYAPDIDLLNELYKMRKIDD